MAVIEPAGLSLRWPLTVKRGIDSVAVSAPRSPKKRVRRLPAAAR